MPSLAFGDPTGVPAGVASGVPTTIGTVGTVGGPAGLTTTTKLESLMPPNLFTKNAAQTFLQPENEANNNKNKLNSGGIVGKNKLSIDTNQSFGQLIAASSSPMSGNFNSGAPRPIADLNAVPIETITNIEYMNLGCNKRTLEHGSTYANSHSRS